MLCYGDLTDKLGYIKILSEYGKEYQRGSNGCTLYTSSLSVEFIPLPTIKDKAKHNRRNQEGLSARTPTVYHLKPKTNQPNDRPRYKFSIFLSILFVNS